MYRGKQKSGNWAYGDLVHLNGVPSIWTGNLFTEIIPGTEGMNTGKIDLEGNAIFEGDIRQTSDGSRYVVEYCKEDASFIARWKRRDGAEGEEYLSEYPLGVRIGNIVDNPDLLEWEVESDWMRAYKAVMQSGVKVEKVVSRIG